MQIVPVIELLGGRCVSRPAGSAVEPTPWSVDPVEMACRWAAEGAERLRVTDRGAAIGEDADDTVIDEIIRRAGIPVDVGGGLRSRARVERRIDRGAARVIVGTLAVWEPELVAALAKWHPDQIVVALDLFDGKVVTHGRAYTCAIAPEELMDFYRPVPLAGIALTALGATEDVEARIAKVADLARGAWAPIQADGIVNSLDDLSRLAYVPGIAAALLGDPLLRGTFDLAAAHAVAHVDSAGVAEFI
ncbi:HisA/HisF-related TIM barrel protein [Chachezhania sediminis]|uniref:HisA/HisF-related TIM barrel protein n=1 Tax=Chachezhania sediminis TaxID=2599291 RepID=UPI00131CC2C0|nr:HisA/HisF-related TIM barrel protein [Chachezhania sediminis]